ncbi:DUF2393 domain-containing protein [Sulfurimonas sp.]
METKITAFIENLIIYDYILFGSAFIFFILFIIIGILLRKKTFLAIFFILSAFSILLLAPTLGYVKLHQYLFKNTTTLTSQKKLEFTQAVVVLGNVVNESKSNFESCEITAKAHKVSKNELKNYIFQFKPIKKMSILEYDIRIGEKRSFKIIVEPFTYSKDYNISIGAKCK